MHTRPELHHLVRTDDHLSQAAFQADAGVTGRLHVEALRDRTNTQLAERIERVGWDFQEKVDQLVIDWQEKPDPQSRKQALLNTLRVTFGQSLQQVDLRMLRSMEHFVELLKTSYKNERDRHLDDPVYVQESITRYGENVELGRPTERDPAGIFAAAEAYLQVANHTIQGLMHLQHQHDPNGTVDETLWHRAYARWSKVNAPVEGHFTTEQRMEIAECANDLMNEWLRDYASVLPQPMPMEAAGFVVRTQLDARYNRRPALVEGANENRQVWVKKVLNDIFSNDAYRASPHDVNALVEAYQALERILGPTPPNPESSAVAQQSPKARAR